MTPPTPWGEAARQSDIALLRGEVAQELREEIAEPRGESGQLRAHIDAQLPKLLSANIASMIGVAGLVSAIAGVG